MLAKRGYAPSQRSLTTEEKAPQKTNQSPCVCAAILNLLVDFEVRDLRDNDTPNVIIITWALPPPAGHSNFIPVPGGAIFARLLPFLSFLPPLLTCLEKTASPIPKAAH